MKKSVRPPMVEVRHSPVHGYGVFALRRIRKGTTIMEYLGDRVSHEEADARYENKDPNDNHTFLFTVDSKTVIDGGVGGNDARYINHGCEPNCESASQNKRIFVEALRTIQAGEELAYDYQIQRDPEDPPNVDEIFACRCGAVNCRGSMLVPPKKPRKKKAAAKVSKALAKKSAKKKSRSVARAVTRPVRRDSRARSSAARDAHKGKSSALGRRKREVKRRGDKRVAARRRGR